MMALHEAGAGAVFAFPMRLGIFRMGAVNLYDRRPMPLTPAVVRDAAALTEAVSRQVLQRALARASPDAGAPANESGGRYSRREVYQASGMLAAQSGVGADDALLLLRAYAFADGRAVRALANDVLTHTMDFTHRNDSAP